MRSETNCFFLCCSSDIARLLSVFVAINPSVAACPARREYAAWQGEKCKTRKTPPAEACRWLPLLPELVLTSCPLTAHALLQGPHRAVDTDTASPYSRGCPAREEC